MKLKYLSLVFFLGSAFGLLAAEYSWQSLVEDGLHDPESPAIGILQEPADALALLPPDNAGNKVAWIRALREGYIEPRTNIFPETKIEVIDMDIIMENTGELPLVLFPHKPHTEWLDCKNCHDKIFVEKVDANPINMYAILSGNYCGQCHGAVAFPLTECNRCHSVARSTFTGKPGVQPQATAN
ncbi:MAG: c(7)-type cytochrome triheme domain-containing protein [Gammaproteobacteria bacterium]